MVYAVGLESTVPYGGRRAPLPGRGSLGMERRMIVQKPDEGLAKIAAETGGGYFELTRAEDLRATFSRVADELHRQYALAFEPTKLDGKSHELEVRVKRPGAKARARKNYVAAKVTP
jgi:VWFA-related protein